MASSSRTLSPADEKAQRNRLRSLPEIWGHRGASAEFPENSMASFRAAVSEGSECIESDVHCSLDGKVLLFHDTTLDRTTNLTGAIKTQPWDGVIEKALTNKAPHQPIPLLEEMIDLLMQPEALHVKFNIDIKPSNDAERLFTLIAEIIQKVPNGEEDLAPRLILGLWHTSFILPARKHLPFCHVVHITKSLSLSTSFFAPHVSGFSIAFPLLLTPDGEAFRQMCIRENKNFGVWTVNAESEMCIAAKLGCKWILTDRPRVWGDLRSELEKDFDGTLRKHVGRFFAYSSLKYYTVAHKLLDSYNWKQLTDVAGPIEHVPEAPSVATPSHTPHVKPGVAA